MNLKHKSEIKNLIFSVKSETKITLKNNYTHMQDLNEFADQSAKILQLIKYEELMWMKLFGL